MVTSLLWGAVLAGCGGSVADISSITFDKTLIDVDSNCTGGCGGDILAVTVAIAEDISAGAGAELDLRQYRVDYAIPSLTDEGEEVPYFAAALSTETIIGFGESITLTLQPVGNSQRAWVYSRAGSALISGTATLKLEGYDQRGELVTIESGAFTVTFSDVAAGSGSGSESESESESSGDTGLF
ncbi:MAG: hypothetical protein ACI8S6_001871 [Myxococcota bacterium]|jgi:hypothetical protein